MKEHDNMKWIGALALCGEVLNAVPWAYENKYKTFFNRPEEPGT